MKAALSSLWLLLCCAEVLHTALTVCLISLAVWCARLQQRLHQVLVLLRTRSTPDASACGAVLEQAEHVQRLADELARGATQVDRRLYGKALSEVAHELRRIGHGLHDGGD